MLYSSLTKFWVKTTQKLLVFNQYIAQHVTKILDGDISTNMLVNLTNLFKSVI